ncbi:nucleoside hydrolase [Paenibacillus sp. GCM10027626]|uniref:nucleoside hydrolase n=1 Tax=Paenibacillus sp. GCM10027626 TaxID=3273411 RepID=UPI003634963A
MRKIIIDTDIGDDIDDALAIALALNSPELQVIGITTVYRNTELRTKLVLQLLRAFERLDIPVATGIGAPLLAKTDVQNIPCQWLDDYHDIQGNCSRHAVDFLLEQAEAHPDVTIVAIGPLTNIAAAVRKAPETMKRVKVVMMAGMHSTYYPEWNVVCDPEAARIVFESVLDLTMVGLDVTLQCRLTEADVAHIKKMASSRVSFLSRLLTQWMDSSKHLPILHDPLTIAYISHPELLKMEPKRIAVECQGEFTRGMTVVQQDVFFNRPQENNVLAATAVDSKSFIDLFMQRLF